MNWNATKEEMRAIAEIARRWVLETGDDFLSTQMDLEACHSNGCSLDFGKLAGFNDANFGHDLGGIRRYLDRETGALTDCFVPRCAA